MSYFNYQEAISFLNCTKNEFVRLIKEGAFPNTKIEGRKYFFQQSDLEPYKVEIPNLNNYYSVKETAEKLEIDDTVLRNNYLKTNYFQNTFYHKGKYYVLKEEVLLLRQKHLDFVNAKGMISSEGVSEILNISHDSVLNLIAKGKFENYIRDIYLSSKWKISEEEVFLYKQKQQKRLERSLEKRENANPYSKDTNYVGMAEMKEHFNEPDTFVIKAIKRNIFKTHVQFNGLHYIKKEEMLSIKNLKELMYEPYRFPHRLNSTEDKIEYMLSRIESKDSLSETLSLFFNYFQIKSTNNRYRDKLAYERNMLLSFWKLTRFLNKEIFQYEDCEIENILNSDFLSVDNKKNVVNYLNYVSSMRDGCVFKNKYNFTNKMTENTNKEIYSKEAFLMAYLYTSNIERHKKKALENKRYASIWFYALMHFSNAWRSSDIIQFPNISELKDIVPSAEVISSRNLYLEEAQLIINTIQSQWEQFVINKTGVLNKFNINLDLMIPMSTCIAILVNHEGEDFLNINKNTIRRDMENFFADLNNFKFLSLKMNRSLLTYFFESTASGENNADITHLLTQKLRRHEDEDTVQQYVMNTNQDGYSDNISYNLFRRGHFGWLYHSLIDIVANNKNSLSFEEKTLLIEKYQKMYSPKEIESLSTFFLMQQNKNKSIAIEIAMLPNEELKNRLEKIFKGFMPSKEVDGQCMFSDNCKNINGDCLTCPFLIPKVYLLTTLKNEVYKKLEEMSELNEHEVTERMKLTFILFKLLNLLNQSVETYGKDYVNTYIDLKDLNLKLSGIDNKILLPDN